MDNSKSYGQIAFEAYGANRDWKDWRGNLMPQWDAVNQGIRDAWEIAASAAIEASHESLPKENRISPY